MVKRKLIVIYLFVSMFVYGYAQGNSSPFHAVVAEDGSGDYTSIQKAIDMAPDNSATPWLIFVKNGSYKEQVFIPKTKPNIHLIGQDKDKTIIHHRLNVGGKPDDNTPNEKRGYWEYSVHNPASEMYKCEGAVVRIEGSHFYSENISYINDWGVDFQSGPQALAMNTQADCVAFNNCIFRSFQDTWMTSMKNDANRIYARDCWIEGAVDYFYGGGDALLENCTFYNVRSGSVIVAPSHKTAKYGYVFRDCTIDGSSAAADGKQKLGRPWHNSPRAIYIHTTMRIPVAPEGWANMGAVPALFAEYDSRDQEGNVLDLSLRKTEYEGRGENAPKGSCPASITREEADGYVYENIIHGNDGWNPRAMMDRLPAPENIKFQEGKVTWMAIPEVTGYIVFDGENIVGFTTKTSCVLSGTVTALSICGINRHGSLGLKSQ
ncbi:pectinesterase family protein [Dysgonomonas termitidis]|uniref:Pectinesterase n=1 Tax=Dysgonomonas termitidis TaxID=1516126 RepID=A0ABV9KS45_9BACT